MSRRPALEADVQQAAQRSVTTVSNRGGVDRDSRAPGDAAHDGLAAEAWRHVQAIAHDARVVGATRALMEETGLTLPTVKALRLLASDEPLAMRQLAARLQCDNSYVTSIVDALEAQGLARRQAHRTDRRSKVIVLTQAGRVLARRAQQIVARPPAAFATLSEHELETLCRLLRRLDPGDAG